MARPLFAFDIDGTLIDTRPSFDRIVRELSGAGDDEIELFRDTGGFNDDWELARALSSWIGAGRPKIVERCENVHDVVLWCGHDPGDLAARGSALYRGDGGRRGYVYDEAALVDGAALAALAAVADVVACTGRDAWEFARAEELLGHTFADKTTAELAKKPDPQALLRLLPSSSPDFVVLFGDTHADRRTVRAAQKRRPDLRFFFCLASRTQFVRDIVAAVLKEGASVDVVARYADGA